MSAAPDFTSCYRSGYAAARARFREVAESLGASLSSYPHHLKGPAGEELAADVAVIGDAAAPRRLLVISGTHGLEGQAGSAAQVAWMLTPEARALPKGVCVVMLHALNPYGFAHMTRTTENNVDLNRNFVDHAAPYPPNPGYQELHPFLVPWDWTSAEIDRNRAAVAAYGEKVGQSTLYDTIARGQYTHPDGTNYGGAGREWSNLTLERIVADHLAGAEKVGFIDWHTGIGDYASAFFLCFNEEGGPLQAEAARWWGPEHVLGVQPNGLKTPSYKGLVFNGVEDFLGGVPMVGAVVEYGTRGMNTRRALQLDVWLKFRAEPDSERVRLLKADLADAFVPVSAHWREPTIGQSIRITQQAVDGLAAWADASTPVEHDKKIALQERL